MPFVAENTSGYNRMGSLEPTEVQVTQYECPECGFSYYGARRYAFHLVKEHGITVNSFTDGYGSHYTSNGEIDG